MDTPTRDPLDDLFLLLYDAGHGRRRKQDGGDWSPRRKVFAAREKTLRAVNHVLPALVAEPGELGHDGAASFCLLRPDAPAVPCRDPWTVIWRAGVRSELPILVNAILASWAGCLPEQYARPPRDIFSLPVFARTAGDVAAVRTCFDWPEAK